MVIRFYEDKASLCRAAAEQAADCLREAIQERGGARIVAATIQEFPFLTFGVTPG